jgi:hypothetical protein
MLNARELRLGNIIFTNHYELVNGVAVLVQRITIIDSILNDSINYDPIARESYCSIKDCFPIPLSEEWVRKFGMESLDMEIDYVEWGFDNGTNTLFHIIQDGIGKDFPFYLEYDLGFGNERREIKYVHQLQNLYFALTGEELEIKEKVI